MEDTQNPVASPVPAAADPGAAGERPSWLPEGFESPEQFRAAYDDLKTPKATEGDGADKPEQVPPTDDQQVADFVGALGFDVGSLAEQIAATGTIDPEAMTKISEAVEKNGLPKGIVQRYIEGEKLKADQFVGKIHSLAGGQDEFSKMSAWAQRNLPPADVKNISDLLESGDEQKAEFAVRSLVSQYRGNQRTAGKLLSGSSSAGFAGDIYHSKEEQIAAMKDPRYKTDPAYQRQVIEKTVRTKQARR